MTIKCHNCDSEIAYSVKPPHELTSNGVVQIWCETCIKEYSLACWPEDFGPCEHALIPKRPGNC